MIGIIYKFTIIAKYKKDGYKPFYIGQHWCKSVDDFLQNINKNYWGSGSIWLDYLKGLKKQNPNNWKYFVKREIIYASESITQKGLDTLERHFIKKYKSHYSNKNGGCNVIVGTANKFGDGSPVKDATVRGKISESLKKLYKSERGEELKKLISSHNKGRTLSKEARVKISMASRGEKSYWYGRKLSQETKDKIRKKAIERYQSPHGVELRKKVSNRKYLRGSEHPFYGKHLFGSANPFYGHHHSEETKRKISQANRKH